MTKPKICTLDTVEIVGWEIVAGDDPGSGNSVDEVQNIVNGCPSGVCTL